MEDQKDQKDKGRVKRNERIMEDQKDQKDKGRIKRNERNSGRIKRKDGKIDQRTIY